MVFAAARRDTVAVRGAILVFLIITALFAPFKVQLSHTMVINFTSVFAAAYISCIAIITMDRGFFYMLHFGKYITGWILYIQLIVFLMSEVPQKWLGDFDFRVIVELHNAHTMQSFFATYIAFILAAMAVAGVVTWCKCKRFTKYMVATTSAYVFGGSAFYTLAYRDDPQIFRVMAAAIVIKVLMTALYYPAIRHMRSE